MLKQIASINAGYPFRGKIPEVYDSTVIAVQMRDISLPDGVNWVDCITTKLTGKRDPDYLLEGDILVAGRGNHNYAVLVDLKKANETLGSTVEAVASPHFFVVRVKHKEVLPEFVAWLLNQPYCQRYFEQSSEGTLTKSIRRSVLEDTPVVIPPLAKQQTIVALAKTINKEQRLMQQLIQNGERTMNAIANDLFNKE